MSAWSIFFIVGIFVVACGALSGLWLLVERSGPQRKAKRQKKPLLSNWK